MKYRVQIRIKLNRANHYSSNLNASPRSMRGNRHRLLYRNEQKKRHLIQFVCCLLLFPFRHLSCFCDIFSNSKLYKCLQHTLFFLHDRILQLSSFFLLSGNSFCTFLWHSMERVYEGTCRPLFYVWLKHTLSSFFCQL